MQIDILLMFEAFMLFCTVEFVLFRHAIICIESDHEIYMQHLERISHVQTHEDFAECVNAYLQFSNSR